MSNEILTKIRADLTFNYKGIFYQLPNNIQFQNLVGKQVKVILRDTENCFTLVGFDNSFYAIIKRIAAVKTTDARTQNALNEMGKAAALALGIEGEIVMTVCPDRNYSFCGVTDGDEIEAGFDDFDEHDAEAMFMNIHSDEGND